MISDEDDYINSVEGQFRKAFELSSEPKKLPEHDRWLSSSVETPPEEFIKLRDELNAVKSLLNCMPLARWHKHTRNQNPAGFVINEVRNRAHPELLTQAWCKFTEILWRFPNLVPVDSTELASCHLCEAPGAFITSLNHFIQLNRKDLQWCWTGTTLNPYHEGNTTSNMINDDRFILHTLNHWDFCQDGTGNILDPVNLTSFVHKHNEKFDLVTADGSIDCQTDPARQEALVIDLHLGEIISCLGILKTGGNFVLKMFTFFETATICHLYLLSCVFKTLTVVKPATSKEGNSEVYVVCQDFQGVEMATLELLMESLGSNTVLFDIEDIDKNFITKLKECSTFFVKLQTLVIKRNIDTFHSRDKVLQKFKTEQKRSVAKKYVTDFNIHPIKSEIVSKKVSSFVDDCRQADERVDAGTFLDKLHQKSEEETLQSVREQLSKLHPSWLPRCRKVEWIRLTELHKLPHWQIQRGAKISQIKSSKFCPCRAINLYKESVRIGGSLTSPAQQQAMMSQKKRKLDLIKFYPLDALLVQTPILSSLAKIYPEILKIETIVIKCRQGATNVLECSAQDTIESVDQMIEALSAMKRGQHLVLLNWILVTRIQVGLFYLLLSHFEEVGFLRPIQNSHGIFLSEFKGHVDNWKDQFEEFKKALNENSGSLLSMFPIDYLTQEPVYSMMVAHNMNIMRELAIFTLKPF